VRASAVAGPLPGSTGAARGVGDSRLYRRGRRHPGQARAGALESTWNDIQDTQPSPAPAPS